MTSIELMTRDPKNKPYIDEIFGSVNVTLTEIPTIPERLLYGRLSEFIHRPDLSSIFIMSDESPAYIQFMTGLAKLFEANYEIIDADSARAGDMK